MQMCLYNIFHKEGTFFAQSLHERVRQKTTDKRTWSMEWAKTPKLNGKQRRNDDS